MHLLENKGIVATYLFNNNSSKYILFFADCCLESLQT